MKTLCFLILLMGGQGAPGAAPPADAVSREVPAGLAKSDWQSIREAYEAGRHVFQPVEGGWQAHNPGQQWTMKFDGRGFLTQPSGANWQWGLELKAYGFPGAERAVSGVAEVKVEGQRLSYDWDAAVQEWFVNDQRGLEHGFTVKERPQDFLNSSTLNFLLSVRGTLQPHVTADAQGVEFGDASGATVLNYTGLKVWDADGKVLASHFAAVPEGVRLVVEERGARYPLTIDPIAQQAYLKASQVSAGDEFGYSVGVSGDTVVVGSPREDGNSPGVNGTVNENFDDAGAAYVFVRSGGVWSQQAYLKPSQVSPNDLFGYSVAVSGDTVVVGAIWEDGGTGGVNGTVNESGEDSGAAYVFVRNGTTWSQQAYLKPGTVSLYEQLGYSVAISGDTVVAGGPTESSSTTGVNSTGNNLAINAGAAWVFVRSGTTWSQQAYLKASQVSVRDEFGTSVAVWGDTAVVGAILEDGGATGVNGTPNELATDAGAAYVFVRSGTTWTQQAYLKASQVSEGVWFGNSVAVCGDTVVAGAPRDNGGSAYVFVRSGTTWSQQANLKANPVSSGGFGHAVAISGDTVVAGAPNEDGKATGVNGTATGSADDSGAAWVFVRSGTSWSQQAYLKAGQVSSDDRFGYSVAISGDTAVVGAINEDGGTPGVNGPVTEALGKAGAGYIFSGVGNRGVGGALKIPIVVLNGVDLGYAWNQPMFGAYVPAFVPGTWNAGSGPLQAADENLSSTYANLGGTQSGLLFFANSAGVGFDQITLHTKGNPLDADPVSFSLYGRPATTPDGYVNGVPVAYLLGTSSLLASGTISLPAGGSGITTVRVPPIPGFVFYMLIFTDLRGPDKSTMQIAEISVERTAPRWGTPAIGHTGNLFFLRATGLQNQVYTLYRNTGLTPGGWLPINETTAETGGLIHFNTVGSSPKSFYRIEEKGVSLAR